MIVQGDVDEARPERRRADRRQHLDPARVARGSVLLLLVRLAGRLPQHRDGTASVSHLHRQDDLLLFLPRVREFSLVDGREAPGRIDDGRAGYGGPVGGVRQRISSGLGIARRHSEHEAQIVRIGLFVRRQVALQPGDGGRDVAPHVTQQHGHESRGRVLLLHVGNIYLGVSRIRCAQFKSPKFRQRILLIVLRSALPSVLQRVDQQPVQHGHGVPVGPSRLGGVLPQQSRAGLGGEGDGGGRGVSAVRVADQFVIVGEAEGDLGEQGSQVDAHDDGRRSGRHRLGCGGGGVGFGHGEGGRVRDVPK
mmetsp:Transcript_28544/g.60505  ORF Transcript_28544/g.60505 Transcript_28544/m.60505 type:complete len:307 (-) Transcript_28544:77-997(-)